MREALAAPAKIRRIAVIGAGQAGRRFALRCSLAGYDVALEDVMPSNLRRAEAEFADLTGEMGQGSMRFALTVEDAVRDADLAIDFVPDELESKLEIFCLIDRMAPPRTILCTPSEALSITDLASCTYRDKRCLALRGDLGSNGPVRLLSPPATDAHVVNKVRDLLGTLGLEAAVEIDPDIPKLVKNARP